MNFFWTYIILTSKYWQLKFFWNFIFNFDWAKLAYYQGTLHTSKYILYYLEIFVNWFSWKKCMKEELVQGVPYWWDGRENPQPAESLLVPLLTQKNSPSSLLPLTKFNLRRVVSKIGKSVLIWGKMPWLWSSTGKISHLKCNFW